MQNKKLDCKSRKWNLTREQFSKSRGVDESHRQISSYFSRRRRLRIQYKVCTSFSRYGALLSVAILAQVAILLQVTLEQFQIWHSRAHIFVTTPQDSFLSMSSRLSQQPTQTSAPLFTQQFERQPHEITVPDETRHSHNSKTGSTCSEIKCKKGSDKVSLLFHAKVVCQSFFGPIRVRVLSHFR